VTKKHLNFSPLNNSKMVLQINSKDFEDPDDGEQIVERQINAIIERLRHSESEGIDIPDELINEISFFSQKNVMDISYNFEGMESKNVKVCCSRCVKAHLIKKANDLGLEGEIIAFLDEQIPGKIGHEGYYLDEGEVKHSE
jgi:hypothetical protein